MPRIVGMGRAMELILTGKVIDAEEAYRIGLANEVVPKGKGLARAKELAQFIATLPQGAIRTDKEAAVRGFGKLVANRPDVQEKLGWATAPEAGYTTTVETTPGGSGRYPGINVYISLPDGRTIELYTFSSAWHPLP